MNIINVATPQLLPGMIVAEDVYTSSKEKILFKNTILSQKAILKLKMHGIKGMLVFIPPALADKLAAAPNINATKANKTKDTTEFKKFKKQYLETISSLKGSFKNIIDTSGKEFNVATLLFTIDTLMDETSNSMRTFELLQCMREYDDLTFVHSLNVALIAKAFGSWLNLSAEDLRLLTVAGLLHDIGKLLISNDIISKPGALTPEEYETIKSHTTLGYQLVKDIDIDPRVKDAVLLHHERSDGSGYPNGMMNDDISQFAKIIAISDVYDAMTANRSYRNGICPFDVVANFEKNSYTKFDITYLLCFLEHIVQSYIHAPVLLSNTLVGEVVMINKNHLSSPIVNVDGTFFDLSKNKSLTIKKVL